MPRRLFKARAAESDLVGILEHSYKNWGVERGDRYFDVLERHIKEVGADPEQGDPREEIKEGYWSKRSQKHVIFYTFTDDEVRIRRVLHAVMEHSKHID